MKILPITNTDYRHKMNLGSAHKIAGKFAQNGLADLGRTAKTLSGAVIVLATISSKSNKKDDLADFQIKDLTNKEFKAKKAEIISHEKDFIAFEWMHEENINKWNVQLLDYMLQNPDEYNDEMYRKFVNKITDEYCPWQNIDNKNQTEVALRMLKMPWFLKAYEYARDYGVGNIAHNTTDENVKDIKLSMLNKLDEYKNTEITFSWTQERAIVQMLEDINTKDGLKVALKLLENPDMLDEQNQHFNGFSEDCFKDFSNQEQYADIKLKIIEKINSKPELFESEYFKHSLAGIFNNTTDENTKVFLFKVLDNPLLFGNEKFADSLGSILYYYGQETEDVQKGLIKILSAIEKKPELFKNEKFTDELQRLLYIQKMINGSILMSNDELLRLTQINLFLIENGYYDKK